MDDILTQALAAQRAAEEQARAAQERAKKIAQFIEAQKQANALAAELSFAPAQMPIGDAGASAPPPNQDAVKRGSRDIIRQKAAEYIQQNGPLPVQQVVAMLKRDGIDVTAKNQLASVSQTLSLDPRFVADRTSGWRLVGDHQEGESPAGTGLSGATKSITGLH